MNPFSSHMNFCHLPRILKKPHHVSTEICRGKNNFPEKNYLDSRQMFQILPNP